MRKLYTYHAEATSVAGFLQVLCANYLPRGCVFYVEGRLKSHMDARVIDADIIGRYEIAISKHARCWRKSQGMAVVHLLRYRLFFLLLASAGRHRFFEREANIKDARDSPVHFGDYTVSSLGGHSCVRLAPKIEQQLRCYFLELACCRSAAEIAREFTALPYEPFKPVVWQELKILRAVNAKRKIGGKGPVPEDCIRRRRRIPRPFDWGDADYDRFARDYAARDGAGAGGEAVSLGNRVSSAA